jgi:hypothetical protein
MTVMIVLGITLALLNLLRPCVTVLRWGLNRWFA